MRKAICLWVIFATTSYSQIARPFISLAGEFNRNLSGEWIPSFGMGVEFRVFRFLKPEIEGRVALGSFDTYTENEFTPSYRIKSELYRTFRTYNFVFSPKFVLSEDSGGMSFFAIYPKYIYSSLVANSLYIEYNVPNIKKEITVKDEQHTIGVGIELHAYFSSKKEDSFALHLFYNNLEIGDALKKLNPNATTSFSSRRQIGASLAYYFKFGGYEEPKPEEPKFRPNRRYNDIFEIKRNRN